TKGDKQLEDVVRESQEMLLDTLRALQAHEKDIGQEITEALKKQNRIGQCKECGGDLLIVRSRAGKRFIGCSNYPECKVTHPLPQTGVVLPTDEVCDVCGSPKVRLVSGGRSEVICVDSECVTTRQRILVGKCKECGGDLLIRHSAQGKRFLGCSNYPKCTETHSLPQRGLILPTELQCKTCSSPMIRVIKKNRKPWLLCINWDCPSKKK
ncbi:MAG: topoisomerase DNA-binding C4 zinc finger domain-containing protein, partial [Thermoplasmata archaeon]